MAPQAHVNIREIINSKDRPEKMLLVLRGNPELGRSWLTRIIQIEKVNRGGEFPFVFPKPPKTEEDYKTIRTYG